MASVYKSLSGASKSNGKPKLADAAADDAVAGKKNKQRVLILSSRGVTYRYILPLTSLIEARQPHLTKQQPPPPPQRPALAAPALAQRRKARLQAQPRSPQRARRPLQLQQHPLL